MRAARPDDGDAQLERRARRTLQAYARDTVDFLKAIGTDEPSAAALFDMPDEYADRFRRALSRGRGAILVTGHFGNWEIGSVIMQRVLHLPLTIVAQAEASAEVNRIRKQIRDALGVETIEVRQSLDTPLQIRRQLQHNRVVAILMDRHLGKDRVAVTLLGRPAWFLRTPALMGYLSGAPLMPCFVARVEGGRFKVHVGEPIYVRTDLPRDEATQVAAQQFADILTERIREHPEYWYQFYRYWDAQVNEYQELRS
jgi:lauroyl/myristoyl acyltransferase